MRGVVPNETCAHCEGAGRFFMRVFGQENPVNLQCSPCNGSGRRVSRTRAAPVVGEGGAGGVEIDDVIEERFDPASNSIVFTFQNRHSGDTREQRVNPAHLAQRGYIRPSEINLHVHNLLRDLEVRDILRSQAYERSRQLLIEHLSPKQKQQYEGYHGYFTAFGGTTDWEYTISPVNTFNVSVRHLDSDLPPTLLCAVLGRGEPLPDQMLAQKLMIEHHEANFLAIAHVSNGALPAPLQKLRNEQVPVRVQKQRDGQYMFLDEESRDRIRCYFARGLYGAVIGLVVVIAWKWGYCDYAISAAVRAFS